MAAGWLTVVRVPLLRADRAVVSAPTSEFHSIAASRSGRGLHLWHGGRLFRLVGASSEDGDGADVPNGTPDDAVSSFLALLFLPVHLFAAFAAHADKVQQERRNVAITLRWLEPVVGAPPPGAAVRPPLPGGWLTAARWTVRLAVLGVLVAAVVALA